MDLGGGRVEWEGERRGGGVGCRGYVSMREKESKDGEGDMGKNKARERETDIHVHVKAVQIEMCAN